MSGKIFKAENCIGCGGCLDSCKGKAFSSAGKYTVDFDINKCLNCEPCPVKENCLGECF